MDKRFGIILGIIIAVFAGYFIFASGDSGTDEVSASPTNHTLGSGPVQLVEYGDFECPACGQFYPILKEVKEKAGDKFTFQFKHFPLESIHLNARSAGRAAEAASKQGKFFEMHDLIYQGQNSWRGSNDAVRVFEGYATQIGLNIEQYKADFSSEETNASINADVAEGKEKGVNSTPTFYLNGVKLDNNSVRTADSLIELINTEYEKVNSSQN